MNLRKATAQDQHAIRTLTRQVGNNPLGLDWRRFWVAVDEQDRVIGIGQIKPHRDGSHELASIAVQPAWQKRGVGRQIVVHLLSTAPLPLYLTCRSEMQSFYQPFGFQTVEGGALPAYFRAIDRLFRALRRVFPKLRGPVIMIKTE